MTIDPSAIAKQLFDDAVADALPDVIADIEQFNTELAGSPSVIEASTAFMQLVSTLQAQAPSIAQAWVKQVNALISNLLPQVLSEVNAGSTSATSSTGSTGAAS